MAGWGCPHEANGICTRLAGRGCDPGMKGCVLAGRYRFSNDDKNRPSRRPAPPQPADDDPVAAADEGAPG